MVKYEIKIELSKTEDIKTLIESAYFKDGFGGKILGNNQYLTITPVDDINWSIFNGLDNTTCKILNEEIIDGTLRFVIEQYQDSEIRLYPISIYCIKESDKYIFY
jgi:hypothetical protein